MRTIDLRGPEGNAFALLGLARRWGKQLELDVDEITKDMESSDYNHLIEVFEKHFGCVCELEGKPDDEDWDEDEDW